MNKRVKIVNYKSQVSYRHEANPFLNEPGATVIVHRGVARSIAIACPDGCGEQLTINLDPRAGPAWRYYLSEKDLSIYPSVWRDTGCKSHFIVWKSKIYWCDWHDQLDLANDDTVKQTRLVLTYEFVSYVAIADSLNLIPWTVLSACNSLVKSGIAERGVKNLSGSFKLKIK